MKTLSLEFDNYIVPLIDVLGEEIEHIECTVQMLDQLRGMVIKRDDENLNLLLEKARIETEKYAGVENRRQMIRKEMARIWGCETSDMTLTRLIKILPFEQSERIRQTKEILEKLLSKFQAEHLSTFMLLSECSRFNEVVLSALLNGRCDESTYNRQGSMRRQNKQSMVNFKL